MFVCSSPRASGPWQYLVRCVLWWYECEPCGSATVCFHWPLALPPSAVAAKNFPFRVATQKFPFGPSPDRVVFFLVDRRHLGSLPRPLDATVVWVLEAELRGSPCGLYYLVLEAKKISLKVWIRVLVCVSMWMFMYIIMYVCKCAFFLVSFWRS